MNWADFEVIRGIRRNTKELGIPFMSWVLTVFHMVFIQDFIYKN